MLPKSQGGAGLHHVAKIEIKSVEAKIPGAKGPPAEAGIKSLNVQSEIIADDITNLNAVGVQKLSAALTIEELSAKPPGAGMIKTDLSASLFASSVHRLDQIKINAGFGLGSLAKGKSRSGVL